MLSGNDKVTLTIAGLLNLLHSEWHAGCQNCPSFGIVRNFLSEDKDKDNFSQKNADDFERLLITVGAEINSHQTLHELVKTMGDEIARLQGCKVD